MKTTYDHLPPEVYINIAKFMETPGYLMQTSKNHKKHIKVDYLQANRYQRTKLWKFIHETARRVGMHQDDPSKYYKVSDKLDFDFSMIGGPAKLANTIFNMNVQLSRVRNKDGIIRWEMTIANGNVESSPQLSFVVRENSETDVPSEREFIRAALSGPRIPVPGGQVNKESLLRKMVNTYNEFSDLSKVLNETRGIHDKSIHSMEIDLHFYREVHKSDLMPRIIQRYERLIVYNATTSGPINTIP